MHTLAGRVEQYPEAAQTAFARLEAAANMVFPGSSSHKRYADIESVGLALVVARETDIADLYDPFDPYTPTGLSLLVNNRHLGSAAWKPMETDEAILGGEVPAELGRFTTFAIAKVNTLTWQPFTSTSVRTDSMSQGRGRVGLAGGQRIDGSLEAVSGLWEVHDHALGKIYPKILDQEVSGNKELSLGMIAEEIDDVVGRIESFCPGTVAAELDRGRISALVSITDAMIEEVRLSRNDS